MVMFAVVIKVKIPTSISLALKDACIAMQEQGGAQYKDALKSSRATSR